MNNASAPCEQMAQVPSLQDAMQIGGFLTGHCAVALRRHLRHLSRMVLVLTKIKALPLIPLNNHKITLKSAFQPGLSNIIIATTKQGNSVDKNLPIFTLLQDQM